MMIRRPSESRASSHRRDVRRVRDRRPEGTSGRRDDQRGAILILALAYIIVVSVVVGALANWASGDLNNTNNFTYARNVDYSATNAMEVAINAIRYTPLVGTGTGQQYTLNATPPSYCWGTGPTSTFTTPNGGVAISVWCSTLENLGSSVTRIVTLSACLSSVSASTCATSPLLQTIVEFDDYPPGGSSPLTSPCTTYCGEGATLASWDWSSVAGLTNPIANSISVTSTPPSIALVGSTYTTASSATSGDTVTVTSATATICTVSGKVVTFVANGTCTIDFNDAGNANYSAAIQKQQSMTVGQLANSITITSAAPANAVAYGATYTPTATATSGDSVVITSGTTSVCTISGGVVSFILNGTCTLNFNDPGNTNYLAATQQQQSFSVALSPPAGAGIASAASPQNGYPNNGDTMTYTFNEPMLASSLKSGFTGSSTSVYVQLSRGSSGATSWQVCSTSNCSTVVNLGTVNLGDSNNATAHYLAPSSTAYLNATMTMSTVSNQSVVTVTLGTVASGTVYALSPTSTALTMVWTPSASATNSAGTGCSTSSVTEANAPKVNF
jgi:hypothetical protein